MLQSRFPEIVIFGISKYIFSFISFPIILKFNIVIALYVDSELYVDTEFWLVVHFSTICLHRNVIHLPIFSLITLFEIVYDMYDEK